jgi:tRNA-dihydrouridine synthase B
VRPDAGPRLTGMAPITIGRHRLTGRALLAPMAGVTDLPFRRLCRRMGAALTAGEMLSADPRLWDTPLSRRRRDHSGEPGPRVVQIAGGDPQSMAEAARRNADAGAEIIDVNMGCPAKRVCNRDAGSALLRDESLVAQILESTVRAVDVPVTLKIRTGWDASNRNGVRIARIAECAGVQALAVHGRTRACRFEGEAEYRTIAEIKQAVRIPVIANGDIDSAKKAAAVLSASGADGVMVGRAAQGRPWIFREIEMALAGQTTRCEPDSGELRDIMIAHLCDLYDFYGPEPGVKIARKHIGWYCRERPQAQAFRQSVMQAESTEAQLALVREHFGAVDERHAAA